MYVNSAAALHSLNLTFIGSSVVDFRRRLCGGDGDDAAGALFRASSGASFGRRRFSGLFRTSTAARRSGGASPRGAVEVAARRVDAAGGANPLRAPHRPSNAPPRAASAEDET